MLLYKAPELDMGGNVWSSFIDSGLNTVSVDSQNPNIREYI